jgi:dolichol kinase
MIWTALAVIFVFAILVLAEYLSRTTRIHAELTRKFVHVAVGTFVAFWPFFLTWRTIQFLSLAFFVVVSLSIKLNLFRSIHAVERNVLGELLFAIVIGMLALIATNKWVFMAAMLNLSLADGLAAIVGLGWGDTNSYKVFGRTKSISGTVAFAVTSLIVLMIYAAGSHANIGWFTYIWLPLLAAGAENVAVRGTDNIVMPLLVAVILSSAF